MSAYDFTGIWRTAYQPFAYCVQLNKTWILRTKTGCHSQILPDKITTRLHLSYLVHHLLFPYMVFFTHEMWKTSELTEIKYWTSKTICVFFGDYYWVYYYVNCYQVGNIVGIGQICVIWYKFQWEKRKLSGSLHGKIEASVVLKLLVVMKRHTTDAPSAWAELYFQM